MLIPLDVTFYIYRRLVKAVFIKLYSSRHLYAQYPLKQIKEGHLNHLPSNGRVEEDVGVAHAIVRMEGESYKAQYGVMPHGSRMYMLHN
jgi:hypothetical protein